MIPFIYCGPEGHNPVAGALYPGRRFYPAELPAELVVEWLDKGWLEDGQRGEPDSAASHVAFGERKRAEHFSGDK